MADPETTASPLRRPRLLDPLRIYAATCHEPRKVRERYERCRRADPERTEPHRWRLCVDVNGTPYVACRTCRRIEPPSRHWRYQPEVRADVWAAQWMALRWCVTLAIGRALGRL